MNMKRKEVIRDIKRLMKDVNKYILAEEFQLPKLDENGQKCVDDEGQPIFEVKKNDFRFKPSLRWRLEVLEGKVRQFNLPEAPLNDISVMQSVLCETQEERTAIKVQQTLLQRERESEEQKLITA